MENGFCRAKSNQGGIETTARAALQAAPRWAKSNQGGIETPADRDLHRRAGDGQNRTKVGLKLLKTKHPPPTPLGKIEPRWD